MLILRVALGITALFRGAVYLSEPGEAAFLNLMTGIIAVALGAFLLLGFLTSIAGAAVFTGGILFLIANRNASIASELYVVVLAAAVLLLGPGAFSLDARLFGRREIIIPKNHPAGND